MPWHRLGTVSVTQNSSTVTGVNTAFAANTRIGDAFIGPDGRQYELGNVASDTVISITPPYLGPTVAGAAYAVTPVQGYQKGLGDQVRDWVNTYGPKMAALGTTGNYDTLPVTKGGTGGATQALAQAGLGLPKTTTRLSVTAGEVVKVADYGRNGGANIVQLSSVDANTLTVPASYMFNGGGVNVPEAAYLDHAAHAVAGWSKQMASALLNDNTYVRTQNNGTFGAWKQFVTRAIGSAIAIADGGTGNTTGTAAKLAGAGIVGTVSQSAGVPTGAVIENGGTLSGYYTKFADGTMICWGYTAPVTIPITTLNSGGAGIYYGSYSKTFPSTFSTRPSVKCSYAVTSQLIWEGPVGDTTVTGFSSYLISDKAVNSAGTFYWSAIGRWY